MFLEFVGVMASIVIFFMFMTMRVTWFRVFMMVLIAGTYYILNYIENGGAL